MFCILLSCPTYFYKKNWQVKNSYRYLPNKSSEVIRIITNMTIILIERFNEGNDNAIFHALVEYRYYNDSEFLQNLQIAVMNQLKKYYNIPT